jgi:hypothetical protein
MGLLKESKDKYLALIKLVQNSKNSPKFQSFIKSVNRKIDEIDNAIDEIEGAPDMPEMSGDIQDLISKLFAFSDDKDTAAIEGAVALAEFGQYEKAIVAFQKILDAGVLPMTVARNMIRCHLTMGSSEDAVSQVNKWESSGTFSESELISLRNLYLETIRLRKKDQDIPEPGMFTGPAQDGTTEDKEESAGPVEKPFSEKEMEDILEIFSFRVEMDQGPEKGRIMEFEVTFQVGAVVSFIVKSDEKNLLAALKPGTRLAGINCVSPISIFEASGVISEMKKIEFGPRRGEYSFRLKLTTP